MLNVELSELTSALRCCISPGQLLQLSTVVIHLFNIQRLGEYGTMSTLTSLLLLREFRHGSRLVVYKAADTDAQVAEQQLVKSSSD